MLREITLLLILPLLFYQGSSIKNDGASPYLDEEAYEVYSAILPSQSPLKDGHVKTLIIRTETNGLKMCLRPEKEWEEKMGPAIAEYVRLNAKPSLLQRKINIEVPYQLINADLLRSTIRNVGWEGFYQQYEHSGGYVSLSAVGFNSDKTVAVVAMSHSCGDLCGTAGFHVLEKKAGRWVPLDWKGSRCAWVS